MIRSRISGHNQDKERYNEEHLPGTMPIPVLLVMSCRTIRIRPRPSKKLTKTKKS